MRRTKTSLLILLAINVGLAALLASNLPAVRWAAENLPGLVEVEGEFGRLEERTLSVRGQAAFTAGKLDEAERAFRDALTIDPTLPVRRELAAIALTRGALNEARQLATRHLETYPRDALGYVLLADIEGRSGSSTTAVAGILARGLEAVDAELRDRQQLLGAPDQLQQRKHAHDVESLRVQRRELEKLISSVSPSPSPR